MVGLTIVLAGIAFVTLGWLALGPASAYAQGRTKSPPASPMGATSSTSVIPPPVDLTLSRPPPAMGAANPIRILDVTVTSTITSGADRLVALQSPTDAGWDASVLTTATSHTGNPSPINQYGATARGILAAQYVAPHSAYTDSLIAVAAEISATSAISYGPDIAFLVDLADLTGDTRYSDLAQARYQARLAMVEGSAQILAEQIRDNGVGGTIPWNIAAWVKAATRLDEAFPGQGYAADAISMTDVIWSDMYLPSGDPNPTGRFTPSNTAQAFYYLGVSGALWAFAESGTHITQATQLADVLINAQEDDPGSPNFGSWPWNSVETDPPDHQTTAFAINALRVYSDTAALDTLNSAAGWLAAQQLSSGGWEEGVFALEFPEVGGEVVWALAQLQVKPPLPPPPGPDYRVLLPIILND